MKSPTFPIVEVYGFKWDSEAASAAADAKWCPFMQRECEKYRQYRFGYCSVTYAAADDSRRPYTYAVCDHRLDGAPLAHVVADHFGTRATRLVPEIVLSQPRTSFDYVAFAEDNADDIIAIETQAIDIRGGGVGPAWQAWSERRVADWREYFTREAELKGRKDTVAYGVNMANIYKRLGLQVAVKGAYLKEIRVPFYVLMQDRPFSYLRRRINFPECPLSEAWDISFVTFDYTGREMDNGQMEFVHVRTVRTTLAGYVAAMSANEELASSARAEFLERVKKKAGLA